MQVEIEAFDDGDYPYLPQDPVEAIEYIRYTTTSLLSQGWTDLKIKVVNDYGQAVIQLWGMREETKQEERYRLHTEKVRREYREQEYQRLKKEFGD